MLSNLNCAPTGLLEYLKDNVSFLKSATSNDSNETGENLNLFVLSDEYEYDQARHNKSATFMDFTPKRFNDEFLARKHLILVYQGSQIVLGMTTFEYALTSLCGDFSRAYIQYVDTTGQYSPRSNQSHLTKSLVKSYLYYCKDVLNVQYVHLLATAKPSFLFPGSEFNEGKRALPSVKLINWWIGLLQDISSKQEKTKVFVYSPAEEAEGSSRMKKRISSIPNWTYGFPYASGLPCVDQIPLFEDDPKWRHFEANILGDDEILKQLGRKNKKRVKTAVSNTKSEILCKMNVKEFFQSIQIRPEFRSDPSAFFVVQFPKRIRDTLSDLKNPLQKKSDLATFGFKMLIGLTFESETAAKESSQKISSWLRLMSVPSCEIKGEILDKENMSNLQSKSEISSEIKVVNSLQSLIKKKKDAPISQ